MTGIYAAHAPAYHKMGYGALPLPPLRKKEPPKGYTGRGAPMPSRADVEAWCEDHPESNIAVRLPPSAVGIDADPYKSPQAAAAWDELVTSWGPLPADAPWSTSRDDGKSGIRWLSIPRGPNSPGVFLVTAAKSSSITTGTSSPRRASTRTPARPTGGSVSASGYPTPGTSRRCHPRGCAPCRGRRPGHSQGSCSSSPRTRAGTRSSRATRVLT